MFTPFSHQDIVKLAGIAMKLTQNTTETGVTHKRKSKSFSLNFFSLFRTAMYDRYVPIQTVINYLLVVFIWDIMFTAPNARSLGDL